MQAELLGPEGSGPLQIGGRHAGVGKSKAGHHKAPSRNVVGCEPRVDRTASALDRYRVARTQGTDEGNSGANLLAIRVVYAPSCQSNSGRAASVTVVVEILIGIGLGLAVAWLALIAYLIIARPRGGALLAEAVRLLPDTLRLLQRLARDPAVSGGARLRLWLLFAYLASPIDLVPDFIPVIGYADDAVMVAAVLRSVVRSAGMDAVRRNWPGTEDGLAALSRLAGLRERQ
jgi:uncharacterized membrane protein YkvA (DUF1232 family)